MAQIRRSSTGTVYRKCRVCWREALCSRDGSVMAVGNARIASVDQNGAIHVVCECGAPVVWQREVSRPRS